MEHIIVNPYIMHQQLLAISTACDLSLFIGAFAVGILIIREVLRRTRATLKSAVGSDIDATIDKVYAGRRGRRAAAYSQIGKAAWTTLLACGIISSSLCLIFIVRCNIGYARSYLISLLQCRSRVAYLTPVQIHLISDCVAHGKVGIDSETLSSISCPSTEMEGGEGIIYYINNDHVLCPYHDSDNSIVYVYKRMHIIYRGNNKSVATYIMTVVLISVYVIATIVFVIYIISMYKKMRVLPSEQALKAASKWMYLAAYITGLAIYEYVRRYL